MPFRFLFHLVFLSVFLIGNTFSCSVFMENMMEYGDETAIIHSHGDDDCCPKDGHKKQIESKILNQNIQKQSYNFDYTIPKNEKIVFLQETEMRTIVSHYKNPEYDKQSLFFLKTIKLLL